MKITVIIPAFNRPALLETALRSVASQTAVSLIEKVIVSENGLNNESKFICESFTNVKIDYIYQEEQLPVSKHMQWLMSLEKENYVAFLCDDDWWDINHLELAVRHLEINKNCYAYFSNFLYSYNENSLKLGLYDSAKIMHLGKSGYVNYCPCVYTMNDVFNYSLIITPFHFSSMFCRGDILAEAVTIFNRTHPTYADRVLWAIIGSMTNIVFNPLATAFIRLHSEMDSHRYSSIEWKAAAQQGSLLVIELANGQGYDLKSAINKIYRSSVEDDSMFIFNQLSEIFVDRKYLVWFEGYDRIIEQDALKKSSKYRVRALAIKIAKNIMSKVF